MLRGLGMRNDRKNGEPMIIKVAGRTELDATLTVYVDESASERALERRERVLEEFDRLESAGVLEDRKVVSWQETDAAARYDEFDDAVEAGALEPFFEELAGGNAIDVPDICVAIHDDEELTGLYPHSKDGVKQTIADCLRALASGDRVRNVA